MTPIRSRPVERKVVIPCAFAMTDLPSDCASEPSPIRAGGPTDAPMHRQRADLMRAGRAFADEEGTDRQLMERAHLGDEAALYDRYGSLVFALIVRIVGDRGIAEEILQDVFLRCWTDGDRYDAARGAVPAWLFGVARNRAIDTLRGRQHQARLREREVLDSGGLAQEPSHPDRGDEIALRHVVSDALGALSSPQRQAIELAYYGGLTQVEIAERVDAPLGTVKTRMRDGLRRLRDLLGPSFGADGASDGEWKEGAP